MNKTIHVEYYAILRLERGEPDDTVTTDAETAEDLYDELKAQHGFSLDSDGFKVVVNDSFSELDTSLSDGDTVIFIPPMVGG